MKLWITNMKNLLKFPLKYKFEKLNTILTFNIEFNLLQKIVKDGFVYVQIIADDNTRHIVKEKVEIEIDNTNAKLTLNIPLEICDKYIRGSDNKEVIYVRVCD